jgi:predicted Zn-dependent protease
MKSYLFGDPNPVPSMTSIYPYFRFDGFTNIPREKDWNMVILENDFIKVFICPDIGGKVWGALEKSTGREFMYFNHVVKFRDVALRGPWTSGGMEYNFGDLGHIPSGATPVDYTIKRNPDGSASCVVGALDLPSQTKWNVEILLCPDKAFFETRVSWFNCTSVPCTYYHWMNAAAKAAGNLQFLYPGNKWIGHGGEYGEWPEDHGVDLSFYENHTFGAYKSYHIINSHSDFFGGYWHDDDFGFGHFCPYEEKPGKKIWIWGLSQRGMIWEDILTDSDGQYVEYQSGKLFNQGAYSSSFTPFKHREFSPHDSDVTSEIWFPLKETKGMVAASQYAVLNVVREGDVLNVYLSALQPLNERLAITTSEGTIDADITLEPLELFVTNFHAAPDENFTIELGANKLRYSSDEGDRIVDRPVEHNKEFNWDSAYGHYLRGLELERQRMYQEAMHFYRDSLAAEPAFVPALNRVALGHYRSMDYDRCLEYILRALAVDTYDPFANYLFGLANKRIGKLLAAKNGFSIASHTIEFRSAGLTELAMLWLVEQNLDAAQECARKALAFNRYNIAAMEIMAIAARKRNDRAKAEEHLTSLAALDPTNLLVHFERVKWNASTVEELTNRITNELPAETYLQLAIGYNTYGCVAEAIEVLSIAPRHPIVLLWLAYLDKKNEARHLEEALTCSPEMVFPYRAETAVVLEYFLKKNQYWKLRYYLALICWHRGDIQRARDLFQLCREEPDFFVFYLAKARLFGEDKEIQLASLERATVLEPLDWRVNLAWIDEYLATGQYEQALDIARKFMTDYPENSAFGFRYARALIALEEFEACLSFFDKYEVLPSEASFEGRNLYHECCARSALKCLKNGDYSAAIEFAQKGKEWPINLGVGKPYDPDERLDDFMIAFAHQMSGASEKTKEFYSLVAAYKAQPHAGESSAIVLQVLSLVELEEVTRAKALLEEALKMHPDNKYIRWAKAFFEGDANADEIKRELLTQQSERFLYDTMFIDNEFPLVDALAGLYLEKGRSGRAED